MMVQATFCIGIDKQHVNTHTLFMTNFRITLMSIPSSCSQISSEKREPMHDGKQLPFEFYYSVHFNGCSLKTIVEEKRAVRWAGQLQASRHGTIYLTHHQY